MATPQKTQIAIQLERIEAAKETLLGAALTFGLHCYDPDDEAGTYHKITDQAHISELSWGFSQIPFYPHGDTTDPEGNPNAPYHANTEAVEVDGPNVRIKEGYYTGLQQATVKIGSTETPTVSIDPANGTITVTKKQTEGYIHDGEMSYDAGTVQHENLVAENIKSGTTVFGIAGTFTADANATSNKIVSGYSAYVNGKKVEGSIPDYGHMGVKTFNILEDEAWMLDVDYRGAVVEGLQVSISNELLDRLCAL